MIDQLLKELKDTWGYTTEELNDIREKFEEVAYASYWNAHNERSMEDLLDSGPFVAYGKKEDIE